MKNFKISSGAITFIVRLEDKQENQDVFQETISATLLKLKDDGVIRECVLIDEKGDEHTWI